MANSIQAIVVTKDAERLATFYKDLFDAPESDRVPPDGAVFYLGVRVGTGQLGIVADDSAADGPQRFLLSVDVDDVDALLPRVAQLGGTILGEPTDMPWGQRVAHVRDVDGNYLNLTQTLTG